MLGAAPLRWEGSESFFMRRSIRTSQRVRRALWYARDPRVSQPKHNGAWVGPPGGQRSKSSAASTEQKSKRAPLNRTIQPAEGTAPCVRKGRLQLRTSNVRFASCALLRARSCARSEWFYVGWMLVFSSALRTCPSAHSGFPCEVQAYGSSTGPDSSRKCGSRGKIQYLV